MADALGIASTGFCRANLHVADWQRVLTQLKRRILFSLNFLLKYGLLVMFAKSCSTALENPFTFDYGFLKTKIIFDDFKPQHQSRILFY